MKTKKKSILSIKHRKKNISAVINNGIIVWRTPWFDVKSIVNIPKETYYAEVGDVLFVDENNKKEIYSKNAEFTSLKENGYRPIGLVVVPGVFNIYGDCSVCCISLNYISEKTPADGTSYEEEHIYFNVVDSTSYNYGEEFNSGDGVAINDDLSKNIKGFYDQPVLPTDYWKGSDGDYLLSNDGVGYYLKLGIGNNSNTSNRAYSPSPYYEDQSQQELWWYSTQTNKQTSQTNINGDELTDLYISKFWDNNIGKINVIKYIKEYNPFNSNTKGEWYLGATGEMAMAATRFGILNNVITKLKLVFGHNCAAYFQNISLITSNIPNNNTELRLKCIGMKSVVISNTTMFADDISCKPMIKFENTTNKVNINIEWNDYIRSITLNGRVYYQWTKVNYIKMPIGSTLKWSVELIDGYVTDELTADEFIVEKETTIKFDNIEEDVSYDIDINQYSIESWDAIVGDYLFANNDGKLFLCSQNAPLNELKEQNYTPIAVVVTPGSHNIYGNCSVGCMALNYLSKDNNMGSDTPVGFKFCHSDGHGLSLPYYETVVVLNGSQTRDIKGFVERPGVPSDYLTVKSDQPTSLDLETQYFESKIKSNLTLYGYCPSPYNENGETNDLYWYSTSSTKYSAQRDVFGKENTNYIVSNHNIDQYPAVKYVKEYAPSAAPLTKGQWYIQSSGELGYSINRMKKIIDAITALSEIYPEIKITPSEFYTQDYWTSTVLNSGKMRNGPGNNIWLIGCNNSSKELNIKPYIRFKSTSNKVKINLNFSNTDDIIINNRHYYSWDNISSIYVKKGITVNWETKSDKGSFIANNQTTIENAGEI